MYLSCLQDKKNFAHFGGLTKMYFQKFKFGKKIWRLFFEIVPKISNFKVPMIFVIEHKLSAQPNVPIFWNWTNKNIPHLQQCVQLKKSLKNAKSLHPITHPHSYRPTWDEYTCSRQCRYTYTTNLGRFSAHAWSQLFLLHF